MAAMAQSYRERRPAAELAPYVTCVFVQEVARDSLPFRHRTSPNGSAEILCRVGSTPQLVGPRTGPLEQVLEPGSVVVGARLRPGAVPALLGMPASEVVDLTLDVGELWDFEAERLGEQVAAAPSPREAARVLERAVAGRLTDDPEVDPIALEAVRLLLPWQTEEVTSLVSTLYISERQLRRRVQAAIGLAPKVLQRMLRFQGFLALAQGREHPSEDLARLAVEAGYADQSHLTRESHRLAGQSPRVVLLESEKHCGPSHDHRASFAPLLAARPAGGGGTNFGH